MRLCLYLPPPVNIGKYFCKCNRYIVIIQYTLRPVLFDKNKYCLKQYFAFILVGLASVLVFSFS